MRLPTLLRSLVTPVAAILVAAAADAQPPDTSFCKEVLLLHHSHLDVGYTHPQSMLWELEKDFLDQALAMLDETADWPEVSRPRWTCEVTAPVSRWLQTAKAADAARFGKYLREGRLGVSAMQYNTTPLCNAEGLARQLYAAREIGQRFGVKLNTANSHDVTGLPWTVADLLLDADVELLIMGINLDFSGSPRPRPGIYRWLSPGGRELLVMNGEHYSMFDEWTEAGKNDLELMSRGLQAYLRHLGSQKYPHDFIYLSTTCAPWAYDNSPPNLDVARLVRRWNAEGRQPVIRYVTPRQLLERIKRIPRESLPVVRGDWTDYWNLGSASSATETRLSRGTTADLASIELLQAFDQPDPRQHEIACRVWSDVLAYNEHTWGAVDSYNPEGYNATTQWQLKAQPVYESRPLADYALVHQLQRLAGNPASAWNVEGVLAVNPGGSAVRCCLPVPDVWRKSDRWLELRVLRDRSLHLPTTDAPLCGPVDLPPYSWRVIPLKEILPAERSEALRTGKDFIESPYYRLSFDPATGRITGLWDKRHDWQMLDTGSPWGFFQIVHEKPDPKVNPSASAYHVRSTRNEMIGLTGWRPDWKALWTGPDGRVSCGVARSATEATLVLDSQVEGVTNLQQRITLRADSPLVELSARFRKLDVRTPEALYAVFPLNLPEGWRSHFDTAGVPAELDAEQIPGTCRDWVTVDSYVSLHGGQRGVALYCPDAPLVQVGGFNFARKHEAIPRGKNPLLAAWLTNNYSGTNFRASQPGILEFRYALSSQNGYDPERVAREAQQVVHPPLVHPAMRCPAPRDGRFLQVEGPGVVLLYVKPAEDQRGIILRLLNLRDDPAPAAVTLPGRRITSACLSSTVEEDRQSLPVEDSTVRLTLPSRRLTTIRVW